MKRRALLAIVMILLLTGCTVVRINTDSIDTIVDVLLSKDNNLYNRVGRGYKYYIPRGVTYIDTDETNDKLYSKGNYYYLYVDVTSYYQKISNDYKENSDAYYSRKISKEDGFKSDGYLEITEKDGLYYIEFLYNYSKIETVVSKNELKNAVLNSVYILSTIQFNDDVIELMSDEEKLNNREEKYEIFKNQKDEDNSELQVYGQ
jgi:hypothetical protein